MYILLNKAKERKKGRFSSQPLFNPSLRSYNDETLKKEYETLKEEYNHNKGEKMIKEKGTRIIHLFFPSLYIEKRDK